MQKLRNCEMSSSRTSITYRHVSQSARRPLAPRRYSHQQTDVSKKPLESILIANRGEIAIRVNKTASKFGIRTVTLYTDPDARSQHAHSSPGSFNLGSISAYLDQDKILELAKQQKCQAIHPGYGFLSENAEFARKCSQAGITFIGPPPSAIADMGDKARSKEIMSAANVPCVPGYHGSDQTTVTLTSEAKKIGYPVLIKAVRGGGGKGMRIVRSEQEFEEMLASAMREAKNSFGSDEVLVEKYITTPRHIEVQVFADKHGNCLALGERDCSIQRRHQKILEESPAPNLDDSIRKDLWAKARAAALAVRYEGAGTVEFIFDNDTGKFYFMEMNTRLQVEHPVTEMVTGLDLVHWQIMVAEGRSLPMTQEEVEEEISKRGHAIEARIYAENPEKNFVPDSGTLLHVRLPQETADVRIDSGFVEGDEVSSHYDPMIAKLIVRGETRKDALQKMAVALKNYEVAGPTTNIDFLGQICQSEDFTSGAVETGYIEKHKFELFGQQKVTDEILTEAALGSLLAPQKQITNPSRILRQTSPSWSVTMADFQPRDYYFELADQDSSPPSARQVYHVSLQQTAPATYNISTASSTFAVTAAFNPELKELTTYFPHTRHTSRIVVPPATSTAPIHLFSPKGSFRLLPTRPQWLAKALGKTEKANSVLSPMPCKILRVDIRPGDMVKKDQTLLVIESMKMETVIRAPADGLVVKRVVHNEGEVVGNGVELVEFEAAEADQK